MLFFFPKKKLIIVLDLELVQDSTRDFSVYVLDPLESLSSSAPDASSASSSQSTQQHHPRGVAVGLGLMSWALLADEEKSEAAQVTGTLMTAGNGEEALEVIFALKEVGVSFFPFIYLVFYSILSSYIAPNTHFPADIPYAKSLPLPHPQIMGPPARSTNLRTKTI
jgi:hypothetical protein